MDFVGADYHHDGHTHIDALPRVAYKGFLYNGTPDDAVTARGATVDSIEVLANGLVGRGVLLDIPCLRGMTWLDPASTSSAMTSRRPERERVPLVRATCSSYVPATPAVSAS